MYIAYTNGKFLYLPEDNVITYNPLSKHQQTLVCYDGITGGYYKHYKDTLSGHIISLYISAILVGQSELTVTIDSNTLYHKVFNNCGIQYMNIYIPIHRVIQNCNILLDSANTDAKTFMNNHIHAFFVTR